ncbi:MAG TPA: hypothetical protein VMS31_08350 [Pyrinomonadaceae bacterium]|nr:hypothetical protein [Pyrinomonadaceae bacterium]
MSRHEDSFQVPLPPDEAKQLCAEAIKSLGWPITTDLGYGLVSAETFQLGFTWPATCQVLLNYGDGGMSRITINASNFGFGPIQSSHVQGKVRVLRQKIEEMGFQGWRAPRQPKPASQPVAPAAAQPVAPAAAQTPTSPRPAPPPPANAPTRQVFVNGVLLREEQVNFLEQKYHSALPGGNYWYDRMCGAWGVMGGPVLCTLEPNHDIGGPLQPGASLGNTGVFINGRELHYLDIALLQRVVPMIIQGRWWLDVYGNFGSEGGPMLGNIWSLAQSQGASGNENRSSVLSSWDRTGVAIFTG